MDYLVGRLVTKVFVYVYIAHYLIGQIIYQYIVLLVSFVGYYIFKNFGKIVKLKL